MCKKERMIIMKKFLLLALTLILCINLFSCTQSSSESEATLLTMDNFEDYIEIDGSVKANTDTRCLYDGDWVYLYNSLKCSISATGNPNYEYKDVVIGVRFYHLAPLTNNLVSEETVYMSLNLAGNGDKSCVLATPVDQEEWDDISPMTYAFYSYTGISSALKNTGYEIVSVEGSVTRY